VVTALYSSFFEKWTVTWDYSIYKVIRNYLCVCKCKCWKLEVAYVMCVTHTLRVPLRTCARSQGLLNRCTCPTFVARTGGQGLLNHPVQRNGPVINLTVRCWKTFSLDLFRFPAWDTCICRTPDITSASYLGGPGFKSRPRDRQSWLRVFGNLPQSLQANSGVVN
jgi:hypothetical protein